MDYIWDSHTPRKKIVHILKCGQTGEAMIYRDTKLYVALCEERRIQFNRRINAPFALGRKVCKHCLKVLEQP